MQGSSSEERPLSPDESWHTIHSTMETARSSMYLAGTTTILLLWGVIASLGYFSQYAIETFAPGFSAERPWFPGLVWGVLATAGMVSSAIIGPPRGQGESGRRPYARRRHQGVPLLACGPGRGLLHTGGGRNVERGTALTAYPTSLLA